MEYLLLADIMGVSMIILMLGSTAVAEKIFEKRFNPGRSLGMGFVLSLPFLLLFWRYLLNINISNLSTLFPRTSRFSPIEVTEIMIFLCLFLLLIVYIINKKELLDRSFYRKLMHIVGGVLALTYLFLAKYWAIVLSGWAVGLLICAERIRKKKRGHLQKYMKVWFNPATRKGEANFYASILFTLGFFILSIYLKPIFVYAGMITVIVGDTCAYVVGKRFGKHRYRWSEKTVEGTIGGTIFSILFLFPLYSTVHPLICIAGVFVAMVIESLPISNLDNFLLPVISGYLIYSLHILAPL